MDDFKRFYSKNDVDKSIPYFWKKFDPDHYSIWFGGYKYNEELTTVLMTCNLITGKPGLPTKYCIAGEWLGNKTFITPRYVPTPGHDA